ncbi:hypothetical protein [Aromatoleum aromaticum]|uniref:hypothetical protein n=1 Tax=Aromatoleum aromaticum TaxID=551760 RepID=UPI0012FF3255|nr:hypothetical protein [Aromatoleum aromaticum]
MSAAEDSVLETVVGPAGDAGDERLAGDQLLISGCRLLRACELLFRGRVEQRRKKKHFDLEGSESSNGAAFMRRSA